jgi:hypothetical protein
VHSHKILGGPIPIAVADAAILAKFLDRFKTGAPSERPWISLVMTSAPAPETPGSMVATALQANAYALFANDLHQPSLCMYATELHLWALSNLQSELRSPRWSEAPVLYTCMILPLFEVRISAS